jgi:hypothetical protein
MRRNRVAPPIDLMAELEGDDDEPKKQSTLTQQPTLVGTQTAPKPKRRKARNRWRPVGRAAMTHRMQRRPHHPPPIRDARRDTGTQVRRPRAGARRCPRPSPVHSDMMLPISPVAAIIYESIHSGALNGSVDSWNACMLAWSGVGVRPTVRACGGSLATGAHAGGRARRQLARATRCASVGYSLRQHQQHQQLTF